MPNLKEAANQIHGLRRYFQSVLDLADAVAEIGSIDNATAEATARLKDKRREEASLDKLIDKARQEAQKLVADATATEGKASLALVDARSQAARIVGTARGEADQLVAAARQEAAQVAAHAVATLDGLRAEEATLLARIDSLAGEVAGKLAEHAAASQKLADAKDQIARLLAH